MPEWSKGVALRSTVLRTRGFEPRFSLALFLRLRANAYAGVPVYTHRD